MYFSFFSNPIVTLDSSQAEDLRRVVDHANSASPNVAMFEVQQPDYEDGDHLINFFQKSGISDEVQQAIKDQLRNGKNLQTLRDFNYVLSQKFYPSDVDVGDDHVVSISSRNSTFSR
jgi:hypothetical protein